MQEAKHTQGPWNTSALSDGTQWTVCDSDSGDMVADLSRTNNEEANARLIAAAPELLEVAELFLRSIDYQIRKDEAEGDTEGANLKAYTRRQVAAAIAKATAGGAV